MSANELLRLTEASDSSKDKFTKSLARLSGDRNLWRDVKWHGSDASSLRKIVRFLGKFTVSVTLVGSDPDPKSGRKRLVISESFLNSIQTRCPKLESIEFNSCVLDYNVAPLRKLPLKLKTLTIHRVDWLNLSNIRTLPGSPFFKIYKRFPKLKIVLDPDVEKKWFLSYDKECIENPSRKRKHGERYLRRFNHQDVEIIDFY